MALRAFLAREAFGVRRNLAFFILILVILPAGAALGTVTFQETTPDSIPVGITPQDESVTEDELSVIEGGATLYASPERYESQSAATAALEREEVYMVIVVPPGLFEEDINTTMTIVSDQRLAPFQEPASFTEAALADEADRQLPATITVEHDRIGIEQTLSEYLVPTALLGIVVLLSFVYVPYAFHRERAVYDRVALTTRMEYAVLGKILAVGALLVVPLSVFQLVSFGLGYRVTHFSPHTMGIVFLTFGYLTAVSTTVMFATRLRRVGLFLNMGLMAAIVTLSSFVYPVGFFSEIGKTIALQSPTYHSMVMIRSTMLKGLSLWDFSPRAELLIGFTVVTGLVLWGSIRWYRRGVSDA